MKKILSFALCMILVFAMPITSATAKTSVPTSGSSNIVSSTTATVSSTVYITSTGTKYH